MDHSHHDHAHMDHAGMGHDMPMDRCSMNMLFTWDTRNLCIVFRQWHIRSNFDLIFSLLAVVAIAAGYEGLRELSRRFEASLNKRSENTPSDEPVTERNPLLLPGRNLPEVNRNAHIIKAVLYGVQNFYAFMLMLVFMTYNGWVMLAVSFGAFLGYLLFGASTSATKENACH